MTEATTASPMLARSWTDSGFPPIRRYTIAMPIEITTAMTVTDPRPTYITGMSSAPSRTRWIDRLAYWAIQ